MNNLYGFLVTCLVGIMFIFPTLIIGYLIIEYPNIFGWIILGLIVISSIWAVGYVIRREI